VADSSLRRQNLLNRFPSFSRDCETKPLQALKTKANPLESTASYAQNARVSGEGKNRSLYWRHAAESTRSRCGASYARRHTMKYWLFLLMAAVVALVGCGAGHANLTSITVSPQSATTTSNPQGQVGYTATGNFANGKNRELSQVDGLSWKTSPTSTGTVAATIGSTGEATCSAPGTVTVTASAPENLQFTVNNGVQNTSATVSGTATLICQ
jgi:hypothetical protein